MKLYEIVHSRTEDMGEYFQHFHNRLRQKALSPSRPAADLPEGQDLFDGVVLDSVVRYGLSQLRTLNFVLYDDLGAGSPVPRAWWVPTGSTCAATCSI